MLNLCLVSQRNFNAVLTCIYWNYQVTNYTINIIPILCSAFWFVFTNNFIKAIYRSLRVAWSVFNECKSKMTSEFLKVVNISILASWYMKRFGSKMTTIFRSALCFQIQVRSSRNFRFSSELGGGGIRFFQHNDCHLQIYTLRAYFLPSCNIIISDI